MGLDMSTLVYLPVMDMFARPVTFIPLKSQPGAPSYGVAATSTRKRSPSSAKTIRFIPIKSTTATFARPNSRYCRCRAINYRSDRTATCHHRRQRRRRRRACMKSLTPPPTAAA